MLWFGEIRYVAGNLNGEWSYDEGPHPSALRAATFPRGEGFWAARQLVL